MTHSSCRFRFTKTALVDLKPALAAFQVYDTETPNLCLLVTPAGAKSFYRQGRVHGKVRRIKIGPFPTLTVDQARRRAAQINASVAEGRSPAAPSRGAMTFADLWQAYWREHALLKKAPASRAHDQWQWSRILRPFWENRKAAELTRQDVIELQARLARDRGHVTANRALSLVKKIFAHAIETQRLDASPAATVRKYHEESRERFLTGDELPRFLRALDTFDNRDMADFWRLALFTGVRQANLLAMRWADIDFSAAIWTISKTKSGRPQRVPLVAQAVEILNSRRNLSEWVFQSHGKTGHLTRPGAAWKRLLARAGLNSHLTMHDLRRSLGSWQAAAGTSELVIGKTLGHAAGSRATAVYARLEIDAVRTSVANAVDRMLAAAEADQEPADVIPIRGTVDG